MIAGLKMVTIALAVLFFGMALQEAIQGEDGFRGFLIAAILVAAYKGLDDE